MRIIQRQKGTDLAVYEIGQSNFDSRLLNTSPVATTENIKFDVEYITNPDFSLNVATGEVTCNKKGNWRIEYDVMLYTPASGLMIIGLETVVNSVPLIPFDNFIRLGVYKGHADQRTKGRVLDLEAGDKFLIRMYKIGPNTGKGGVASGGTNRLYIYKT